jgi:hypothetical protein
MKYLLKLKSLSFQTEKKLLESKYKDWTGHYKALKMNQKVLRMTKTFKK